MATEEENNKLQHNAKLKGEGAKEQGVNTGKNKTRKDEREKAKKHGKLSPITKNRTTEYNLIG